MTLLIAQGIQWRPWIANQGVDRGAFDCGPDEYVEAIVALCALAVADERLPTAWGAFTAKLLA